MEAAQNILLYRGAAETLINDKEHARKSMISLHASNVVCRLRLVCNLLHMAL